VEKVQPGSRPDWLTDDQVAAAAPSKPEPAAKDVPWRTPGSPQPAAPKPAARKPAAPVAVAAPPKPVRRHALWERLLPLLFLLLFVLVVGGYLAGWHLG
jgi:hypothetical protein